MIITTIRIVDFNVFIIIHKYCRLFLRINLQSQIVYHPAATISIFKIFYKIPLSFFATGTYVHMLYYFYNSFSDRGNPYEYALCGI